MIQQRCLHHQDREAAARCPSCRRHFCRECVTEHDGKVICAGCLAKLLAEARANSRPNSRLVLLVLGAILGCLLAWIVFYSFGTYLASQPSEMHGI